MIFSVVRFSVAVFQYNFFLLILARVAISKHISLSVRTLQKLGTSGVEIISLPL